LGPRRRRRSRELRVGVLKGTEDGVEGFALLVFDCVEETADSKGHHQLETLDGIGCVGSFVEVHGSGPPFVSKKKRERKKAKVRSERRS
jgi:hypothetical protein